MPLLLVLFWEKQSLRASILNPFCISIFVIAAESACSSLRRFKSRCFCRPASPCEWWQHCLYFPSIFKSGHVEGVKQGGSVNPFRKQGELNQARYYYLHSSGCCCCCPNHKFHDRYDYIYFYISQGISFWITSINCKSQFACLKGSKRVYGEYFMRENWVELVFVLALHSEVMSPFQKWIHIAETQEIRFIYDFLC